MIILLKNNSLGTVVINHSGKPLVLDGGAQKEVSSDILRHPQIQTLLSKNILSKIERRG